MLAAHMDAIGLMVSQVDGEFLRVTPIGGIDARVMPGQLVIVHGKEDLPGVVAQPAAFLLPQANREGVVPVSELLVDVGLPADKLGGLVKVGDVISFAQPPRELQNETLTAKSLDNRASVAALTVCLDALQNRPHVWDVVAVATVQEEVGLRGAATSAFALRPDLAVAVDVTFGAASNNKEDKDRTFPLGGGPALGLGPNIHPGLHAAFKAAADRAEIPHTIEPMPAHSGTDAFAIQVAREGIPTMVVSIPLRNMHTPVELLAIKDVTRTGRLLAEFITGLGPDFMSTLTFE
ncbi:MAG: M42 family peptidase [Chloroflexi bacterium]|nr:M42 family peptidase [Chloroflexota bacterium]